VPLEGWAAEQGAREALDQAKLEQVQREHRNFLIFTAIGRELSAFAVMDYDLNGAASVVRNRSAEGIGRFRFRGHRDGNAQSGDAALIGLPLGEVFRSLLIRGSRVGIGLGANDGYGKIASVEFLFKTTTNNIL
jgi:hypothetical protein